VNLLEIKSLLASGIELTDHEQQKEKKLFHIPRKCWLNFF
jgi:hypothetical protein